MSGRCPSCGTEYADDARFCQRDGTRLEPVTAAPSVSAPQLAPPAAAAPPEPPPSHARIFRLPRPEPRASEQRLATPGAESEPALDYSKLAGETLDARYAVTRKIGEGGMSFVYLAEDIVTHERVAIKILSPALSNDRTAMARLRREAMLGGKLAHPNVCHIIRLGETSAGMVYVVMPFVEGELLCDVTNRRGQLPLDLTVRYIGDIAAGLQVAHALGIVHRDLKPENIMIGHTGTGPDRAIVMDFGLAKERQVSPELQRLTATGIVLGTPEFMSPEQLRGKPLDARTDVYSLGLMAYEMLSGKLPFVGRTPQEIMIARLKSDPVPIRTARPDLAFSAAVEKVLLRSMQREPDARYQTAPELATALASAARASGSVSGVLDRLLRR